MNAFLTLTDRIQKHSSSFKPLINKYTKGHSQLTDREKEMVSIYPEGLRIYIGIEDSKDIIADLEQALNISS